MLRAKYRWLAGLLILAGWSPAGIAATAAPPIPSTRVPSSLPSASVTPTAPAGARPTSATAARIHARIWLAADPTIESRPGEIRLSDHPQLFNAKFSAPMDRASAERAFHKNLNLQSGPYTSSAPTTASLGMSLYWHNDQFVEVRIERPRGTFPLSFVGARTRDGRELRGASEEFLRIAARRPQILKRIALDGRELGAWPVENEILDFDRVYEGKCAVAWRGIAGEDGTSNVPLLVEVEHGRLASRMIPGHKDGIWSLFASDEWNPATRSLVIGGPDRITSHSLESIRSGRPGRVLYQIRNGDSARIVGMRVADGGERIALLRAESNGQWKLNQPVRLTLIMLDPAGRVLIERPLPLEGREFEYGPSPVSFEWLDGGRLLIKAYAVGSEKPGIFLCDPQQDNVQQLIADAAFFRKAGRWLLYQTAHNTMLRIAEAPTSGQTSLKPVVFNRELSDVGRVLPVGRDQLIVEESPNSDNPTLSLLDPARGEIKPLTAGHLAGADKTSIWLTTN